MTWDRERQQDEALFSIQRDFLNLNFSRQPPFNDRELVSVWIIVLDCGCWTLREQINSSAVVRIKKSRSYDGWKICSNVNLFPAGMVNNNDPEPNKGPYIKYDRNLGGRGGWWIAVSISNSDIILFSNNDVILQSEGGRGSKKAQKLRSYLMYGPLTFDVLCLSAS